MVETGLRRDIAQHLSQAREKAEGLAQATDEYLLLDFIQVAIIEVRVQQAEFTEANPLILENEDNLPVTLM